MIIIFTVNTGGTRQYVHDVFQTISTKRYRGPVAIDFINLYAHNDRLGKGTGKCSTKL